ncbi:WD repeat-containing protein 6 isoform X1 [Phyllopteryx taeniolatus]|uniref:WD repeat-containing protein 6 isoform X1 n=1 Tax=Phyllopteryx taeniolatus TaxID=161469 RepID=UPI002AD4C3E8|nr:WD repeat-containing protein 6 isoform X1 [Phyllopteryx taeniolatus]XP_061636520.1 WD repeat-containing protein 6 isoform X1 [Phyllopteryx taeniolatus]XP_061636526.1 WD repeat-containing protein 6 isoform X1 [Phyllopteryx taeniolatus]
METAALVVPVTALEFLQNTFLLTGEGPVLTVYTLQPAPKACTSVPVLQQHRIHGIRPRVFSTDPPQTSFTESYRETKSLRSTTEPNYYDLAVFGGKAVRLVRLNLDVPAVEHARLEILSPIIALRDWVLDIRWLYEDKQTLVCVAVAHNGALLLDISSGTALAQCSCLEGCLLYSALLVVHKTWADTVLVGGTVFNQLVLWKPGGGESDNKAPVERRLLGHTGVIFSISYLQEKGWLASASDDRSVRVWAVGALGGSGGNCGDLNPTCLRVLFGHQARVFSVCLSLRKVFSAGEDGTCLIWDWVGVGTVLRTLKGHRAGGIRALAVSTGRGDDPGRWVATGGADGGLRLWKVQDNEEEDSVTETTTDLEFSGQGTPKVVCVVDSEADNKKWRQCSILVCTEQGIVYRNRDAHWELVWQGSPEFQSYCVMETVGVRVKDSPSRANLCAVGSLSGALKVFHISDPHNGTVLQAGSGKIHSLTWQQGEEYVYLLASGADGQVYRWCIDVRLNEIRALVLGVKCLPSFVLPACAKRWLTAAVRLPTKPVGTLWVCGDRRGSLLLFQEDPKKGYVDETTDCMQACGKPHEIDITMKERPQGHNGLTLSPQSCLFGVHGKQGVTSISEYQGLLYSTGRDGCVRIFRVHYKPKETLEGSDEGILHLEVLRVQRACKGMEWLERALILEPNNSAENGTINEFESQNTIRESLTERPEDQENWFKMENKGTEARFVIFGFHATQFVVWDPLRQEKLLAVPCGGGHRSWSFWPNHTAVWPGYGALVFIKKGSVLASEPPRESPTSGGRGARNEGWILREGIHGRGIGCVCRLGSIWVPRYTIGNIAGILGPDGVQVKAQWEIIVTGGEDTSLTVLAVHPNSGGVKVLSVITDHISSVRTMEALTHRVGQSFPTESQSLSALLISASGRAQIQCYRLWIGWDKHRLTPSCQVVQVASHRLDEHWERRRNRHKMVKMDPETRYMSMAVVEHSKDAVVVALACSDGAVRLFSVSEVKRQIDLLWETFYHQRCVLSIATCSLEDGKGDRHKLLFSAATDGKIAVWDLTRAASSSTSGSPGRVPTPPIPCLTISAHQSGVNTLAVWAQTQGHQDGGCLVTVPSGGDDGQLTVSTIRVDYLEYNGRSGGFTQDKPQTHLSLHLLSKLNIPLAHAAPLTALKLLRPGLIVTASSDQRVCFWELCSTAINHRGVLCSHVADAAGLAVWEEQVMVVKDGRRKTGSVADKVVVSGKTEGQTRLEQIEQKAGWRGCQEQEVADGSQEKTCDSILDKETEHREEMQTDDQDENDPITEIALKTSCEKRLGQEITGWVLVCGQGFQLLRIKNKDD